MKWSNIFTLPDPSIVQEGSVDPLGMQVVWTHFGQKIFANKLTTVATDIRNYSVNLLQLHVLDRLKSEHSVIYEKAIEKYASYNNEYDLKAGLLILMEDAMVFSLMLNNDKAEVDILGLLGSYNAEKQLANSPDNIVIEAEKSKGVLVRQLQLGVTGRYKGPFINMGLLTKTLQHNGNWNEVSEVINQWPEGRQLTETLLKLICNLLEHKGGKHPVLLLAELHETPDVIDHFVKCFGKLNMNAVLRKFWLEKLGLEEGAAKALYDQVGSGEKGIHSSVIIEQARRTQSGEAQTQLEQILRLEPFLSSVSQVFYLMTDIGNKKLSNILEQVEQLADRIKLDDLSDLENESPRLKTLVKYVKEADGDAQQIAEKIVEYHTRIMENRGGAAWIEIQDDQLKHYIAQRTPVSTKDFLQNNYWYHDYYLGPIRSIYFGLNPN
jgi:hypothetical protein